MIDDIWDDCQDVSNYVGLKVMHKYKHFISNHDSVIEIASR